MAIFIMPARARSVVYPIFNLLARCSDGGEWFINWYTYKGAIYSQACSFEIIAAAAQPVTPTVTQQRYPKKKKRFSLGRGSAEALWLCSIGWAAAASIQSRTPGPPHEGCGECMTHGPCLVSIPGILEYILTVIRGFKQKQFIKSTPELLC